MSKDGVKPVFGALAACKKKPPLPELIIKKTRRLSHRLVQKTREKRKHSDLKQLDMGQSCTKRTKVDCHKQVLSPRKNNKIQPSPDSVNLQIPGVPSCPPSRLSVNQIQLQGHSDLMLERAIPEAKKGEEEVRNNRHLNNGFTTPTNIKKPNNHKGFTEKDRKSPNCKETSNVNQNKILYTKDINKSNNNFINHNSNLTRNTCRDNGNSISCTSSEKELSIASSISAPSESVETEHVHTSVPDLRQVQDEHQILTPSKEVNRRCSHGDVQLKKSFGSANLLHNNVVLTKQDVPPQRHHSMETVYIEKRRKKVPTKENRIHNLEADQVNCYQILEEIGRGSFGAIYKCHCAKDNNHYAMKIISKKRLMRKNGLIGRQPGKKRNPLEPLHREIAILKKMDHPHIVKLVEVMEDLQVDNVYMVFELMKNGIVIEIPTENTIPEDRARRLFTELLLGIEYLHYSKIIHRDIKPSNLLLDDNDHVKIADFGVSDMFEGDDDLLNKYAGSPAFQAPEVLNHDSRDKYSGKAVDVWAMGITLFCFLYGRCPFFSESMGGTELINKIKNDPLVFPDTPAINPQAQDLISRMLSKGPKERITVLEMKEHHWVTNGGRTLLPSTEDHCRAIEVTDEEVQNSVKIISKLSSLVFAKSLLKKSRRWKRISVPTGHSD